MCGVRLEKAIKDMDGKTGFLTVEEGGHRYDVCRMACGLFIQKDKEELSFTISEKIPESVLMEAAMFFRRQMPLEAAGRIYRKNNGSYFFHPLKSVEASHIHVRYEDQDEPEEAKKGEALMVSEVHSHNSMPAFFSEQDRISAVYPGLYICVGNLNSKTPSVACCAEMYLKILPLNPKDVFR